MTFTDRLPCTNSDRSPVLVDELSHRSEAGEGLWHSLLNTAAKRANCILVIISNAGTNAGMGWQWRVMKMAQESTGWYFHSWPRPANWISESMLDEQRRLLPGVTYNRLWRNIWSSGEGDALLPEDIDLALAGGPDHPLEKPERGWVYAAGLNLELRRDASASVITGKEPETGRYRLAKV